MHTDEDEEMGSRKGAKARREEENLVNWRTALTPALSHDYIGDGAGGGHGIARQTEQLCALAPLREIFFVFHLCESDFLSVAREHFFSL